MSEPIAATDRLRVLIPHWIEHNREHAEEFARRAEAAGEAGADIRAAADAMDAANRHLAEALKKLGGALPAPPHSHSHSH